MTCGQTREEVLANLQEALVSYVTTSLDNNLEIPEPLNVKGVLVKSPKPSAGRRRMV
jgi:predicted RNase H-like HicB family nuclease